MYIIKNLDRKLNRNYQFTFYYDIFNNLDISDLTQVMEIDPEDAYFLISLLPITPEETPKDEKILNGKGEEEEE